MGFVLSKLKLIRNHAKARKANFGPKPSYNCRIYGFEISKRDLSGCTTVYFDQHKSARLTVLCLVLQSIIANNPWGEFFFYSHFCSQPINFWLRIKLLFQTIAHELSHVAISLI